MVIDSSTESTVDQNAIAELLGICVPPNTARTISNLRHSEDPTQWGAHIETETINSVFESLQVRLEERFTSVLTLQDWELQDALARELARGNHILCGLQYDILHPGTKPTGHVLLVLGVARVAGCAGWFVQVYDPGPDNPGCRVVQGDLLHSAISAKRDGLWVIRVV
jgi:hypothetical protein